MSDRKAVVHVPPCTTAEEFFHAISPLSEYFRDWENFYFRGHADDRWELVPNAFRIKRPPGLMSSTQLNHIGRWGEVETSVDIDGNILADKFIGGVGEALDWNSFEQVVAEWYMLSTFFKIADKSGLPLPEDSQVLRRLLEAQPIVVHQSGDQARDWPPEPFLSLLALAQHYGLPTRLLDWSRNALVAAYLAAEKAACWHLVPECRPEGVQRLGVWAFFATIKNHRPPRGCSYDWIESVTAPAASNPNLNAQKGLFTLYRPKEFNWNGRVDRRPMDELIEPLSPAYKLFHFTLPISEAPALLSLLRHHGITGATVFAGYYGAARAVMEDRYLGRMS